MKISSFYNKLYCGFLRDRHGLGWRYTIKIREIQNNLGWSPSVTFEQELEEKVRWYQNNPALVDQILNREDQDYYNRIHWGRLETGS